MAVIESPKYQAEAEQLAQSPVIIAMARAIPKLSPDEYGRWPFISAASSEANRQGAQGVHSIGGPARAVKILHDQGVHLPLVI